MVQFVISGNQWQLSQRLTGYRLNGCGVEDLVGVYWIFCCNIPSTKIDSSENCQLIRKWYVPWLLRSLSWKKKWIILLSRDDLLRACLAHKLMVETWRKRRNSNTHTHRKDSWDNVYHRKKWTWRHGFKSWMTLIAFHIALIPLEKVWI